MRHCKDSILFFCIITRKKVICICTFAKASLLSICLISSGLKFLTKNKEPILWPSHLHIYLIQYDWELCLNLIESLGIVWNQFVLDQVTGNFPELHVVPFSLWNKQRLKHKWPNGGGLQVHGNIRRWQKRWKRQTMAIQSAK